VDLPAAGGPAGSVVGGRPPAPPPLLPGVGEPPPRFGGFLGGGAPVNDCCVVGRGAAVGAVEDGAVGPWGSTVRVCECLAVSGGGTTTFSAGGELEVEPPEPAAIGGRRTVPESRTRAIAAAPRKNGIAASVAFGAIRARGPSIDRAVTQPDLILARTWPPLRGLAVTGLCPLPSR
jgi:hypothetical protein